MIAVAMPLFGQSIVFPMILPLGLSQTALAVWLIARGLREAPVTNATRAESSIDLKS
jgi:hypothetical protein